MNVLQHPAIGFGLVYSNKLIYSEAIMQDNHFDVLFDGNWVALIAHTMIGTGCKPPAPSCPWTPLFQSASE
jgi:hypothetical protein